MQVGDKVRGLGGRLGTVVDVWDPWSDGGVIDVDALWCAVQWNDLDYGDYRTESTQHLVLASDQDRLDRNPHARAAIEQGRADLENGEVVTIDMSKIPGMEYLPSVTRVEVIDHRSATDPFKARAWGVGPADIDVAISFQDANRTLKVFVRDRATN